jgi:carboxypeptidase D
VYCCHPCCCCCCCCCSLIHHLAHGYGRKHRITQLLDNICIHALPSMNPDGHEADTRLNSNSFDLNRNFPLDAMPYDPPNPEPSGNDSATVQSWRATGAGAVQPEVAAVMEWSKQHGFVLSASLHQGALVANYPHDACDTQVSCRMLVCRNLFDQIR